jgi:hypothetical protein
MATVGKPPPFQSSYALQDGRWLLGLANGLNRSYQNGITAHSGGTKAAAFQLPANVALFEIDTVAADTDSALLPAAKTGQIVMVFNAGAHTLDLYGRGTDTINLSATATAYALTTGQCALFFCSKDGAWGAIKTA